MLIAGIDPGVNGAIAVLDSENPDSVALLDLKMKNIIDIWEWLQDKRRGQWYDWDLKIQAKIIIWIEDIHSMYGMSAKSNFSFGKNLGIVTAITEIFTELPPNTVTPKVWQKYVGVTAKGKAIKQQVAKIAQYLYPQAELHGKRGGLLDGRSDALMIAYYGLHNLKEKV
jgi:hypothetical protein